MRVAACSHRRRARLRQVAHEALVLPRRRDSARQVRARAPRPLCLHLPRGAVVLQLAAARVRGWCACRVLACTTPRSFGSNSDSMCAKACMLNVCTSMTRVYILVLFLAAMQEPGDEPPAKRTRIASHAGANTAIGSLKLRLLVSVDTEASTSVDASKRLAWALLGHPHSWARTTESLNYDVLCKIGNGCETQSPIITQNIMHRMTLTNRVPRTCKPQNDTQLWESIS